MFTEKEELRSEATSRANKLCRGLNLYKKYLEEGTLEQNIHKIMKYLDNVDEDIEFIKKALENER